MHVNTNVPAFSKVSINKHWTYYHVTYFFGVFIRVYEIKNEIFQLTNTKLIQYKCFEWKITIFSKVLL